MVEHLTFEKEVKMYLDDMSPIPETWDNCTLVKTSQDAIEFLKNNKVFAISLDHDLGACDSCMEGKTVESWLLENNGTSMPNCEHFGTGYTVLLWIEEQVIFNTYIPPIIFIHTANPSARIKMLAAVDSINRRFKSNGV